MTAAVFRDVEGSEAITVVIASMIGLVCICLCVACVLIVLHFKERHSAPKTFDGYQRPEAPTTPAGRRSNGFSGGSVPGASGTVPSALGGQSDIGSGVTLRRRSGAAGGGGTASPLLSTADFLEANSSVYDTQDYLDTSVVQEILGSVDAHHIQETQILLSSFNWDMDELFQQEMDAGGRGARGKSG